MPPFSLPSLFVSTCEQKNMEIGCFFWIEFKAVSEPAVLVKNVRLCIVFGEGQPIYGASFSLSLSPHTTHNMYVYHTTPHSFHMSSFPPSFPSHRSYTKTLWSCRRPTTACLPFPPPPLLSTFLSSLPERWIIPLSLPSFSTTPIRTHPHHTDPDSGSAGPCVLWLPLPLLLSS